MSKFFKSTFKTIKSKGCRYFFGFLLVIILIIGGGASVYKVGTTIVKIIIQTADYFIAEEQKRDLIRFEDKIIVTEEHINKLQSELESIKVGRWVELSEEQKRSLLKIIWELRKDSWRIESALINHENDWSVNLYPRSDEDIENKFKNYWTTHILVDRVIDDMERVVYGVQGTDKFQVNKLQEDIKEVEKIFELRR